jgi:uncharacterized protein YwqG
MNRDNAVAILQSSRLAKRFARIEPHLMPLLRIRTKRDRTVDGALVSRFAGTGVLRRGATWPVSDESRLCDEGAKPLDFLALIRLADVAPHASLLGLPERGALMFFCDIDQSRGSYWPEARGGWSILYAENEGDLELVEREVEDEPVDRPYPSRLTFELEYVLPEDIREETGDDDLACFGDREYQRVYERLRGFEEGEESLHQLCGPPAEVQHSLFHECQLTSNGVTRGCSDHLECRRERIHELEAGVKDWRLLLQIGSDRNGPNWTWGDMGRLYFCIRDDDLAARRFEKSRCAEQSG